MTLDSSRVSRLKNEIIKKAAGVFLWVDVAVKDQVEGVRNGDSIDLLEERLWLLPDEIEDLYARMLDQIGKIYQKEVATYLRVAVDLNSPTLFDIVLAVHGQEASTSRPSTKLQLSEVVHEVEVIGKRIDTICGGLLEVHDSKKPTFEQPRADAEGQGQDRSCGYCKAYPTVTFCHQTASEYLLGNEKGRQFLGLSAPFNLKHQNKNVLEHKLKVEKLRVLGIPACVHHQECLRSTIIDIMSLAGRIEKDTGKAEVSLMDDFDNIVTTLDRQHCESTPDRHWSTRWGDPLSSPHDFLTLAADYSVYVYVQHVLANRKDPIDRETASRLLYHTVFGRAAGGALVSRTQVFDSQIKLVNLLLRKAANLNMLALGLIWREVLCQMCLRGMRFKDNFLEDDAKSLWIESIEQFLLQGADVTTNVSVYSYDFEVEGFPGSLEWRYTGSFTFSPLSVIRLCLGSEPEYQNMEKTCLARGGVFYATKHELQFSGFVGPQAFTVYHLSERQSERFCRDFEEYMLAPFALVQEAHRKFKQRLDQLQKELHDNNQMEDFRRA